MQPVREEDREKVCVQEIVVRRPRSAAVFCAKDSTAVADRDRALLVDESDAGQRLVARFIVNDSRLPRSASVFRYQKSPVVAHGSAHLLVRERDREEMRACVRLLSGPRPPTVAGLDELPVAAHGPRFARVIGRYRHGVKVVLHPFKRGSKRPSLAAVVSGEHYASRPNGNGSLTVNDMQAVERGDDGRDLSLPVKTPVARVEYGAITAHCPSVTLIASESDGVDRVSLRQRVLPQPPAFGLNPLCRD